jgi:hypothetical protein
LALQYFLDCAHKQRSLITRDHQYRAMLSTACLHDHNLLIWPCRVRYNFYEPIAADDVSALTHIFQVGDLFSHIALTTGTGCPCVFTLRAGT